ncbi:MAG TPA: sulfatase-like hydrolase/transferase [Casimicrobiaceae bacterium]|jgi:membrane-anchored protein YejM (alkaline phosphatase superfamily)
MLPPILFVTLDSCRYDAFTEAKTPNLSAIGPLVRAQSPSHFTFASHAAFFMGFTPGDPLRREPYANPKYGKIFRMEGGGDRGVVAPYLTLKGRNIVDGLKNQGYRTIGTGAVGWFNPEHATGRVLSADFDVFAYNPGVNLKRQLKWIEDMLAQLEPGVPPFVFLNLSETHVPYWHDGAPWDRAYNPCVPFGRNNDAAEARRRQVACIEYCDTALAPLLDRFADGTVIVCSDHGDCWGEDGLWAHGVSHARTLEVPLLFRLAANA